MSRPLPPSALHPRPLPPLRSLISLLRCIRACSQITSVFFPCIFITQLFVTMLVGIFSKIRSSSDGGDAGDSNEDTGDCWHPFGSVADLPVSGGILVSDTPRWKDVIDAAEFRDATFVLEGDQLSIAEQDDVVSLDKYWIYTVNSMTSWTTTNVTFAAAAAIMMVVGEYAILMGCKHFAGGGGEATTPLSSSMRTIVWCLLAVLMLAVNTAGITKLRLMMLAGMPVHNVLACVPRDYCTATHSTFYIRVESKQDRDRWLFHLSMASSNGLIGVKREWLEAFRLQGNEWLELDSIKSVTEEHKCAYIDMLRWPNIGPATHFVSHTWSQDLDEKSNALQTLATQQRNRDGVPLTEFNPKMALLTMGVYGLDATIGPPLLEERTSYLWIGRTP